MSTAPQSPPAPDSGAADPSATPAQQSEPEAWATTDRVRVRRAPKYPVFIFGGIIVGIIVTFIAVALAPGRNDDDTPFLQAFGYFVLYGIAIGACVGSAVAVLADWVSGRRARDVDTERTTVEPVAPSADPEAPVDGEIEE